MIRRTRLKGKKWESDKPDFVVSNHSSGRYVTVPLERSVACTRGERKNRTRSLLLQIGFIALCFSANETSLIKPAFSALLFLREQRIVFCYTFRSLTAPSVSLVSSPVKSGLSSLFNQKSDCLLSQNYLFTGPKLVFFCV